jgi:UbiD family decarboxylase
LKSDIGCWVGVVAEGINPMDLEEVIWAMSTRSNPEKDVDILRHLERTADADLGKARNIFFQAI